MDAEFDDPAFVAAAASLDRPAGRDPNASNANRPKVVQPVPQKLKERQGPSAILVSTRQKGNPVLNYVKTVPWEYSDIPCDYVVGATSCVLFLSLKYHRLHPEYIYNRIRQLGKSYNLRILLTMVDIENHEQALQELSKTSMINNLTLILAWSAQEAGRYLELYKAYEHASPNAIRARQSESWQESLTEFITTPRQINKTDAASLISNFGSLRSAVNAEPEELALIPGWGEKKVRSWYTTVREPFRIKRTARQTLPNLDGNDSNITEGGSGSATPEYIPVGSIPARQALSRENTRSGESNSRPTTSHKRHRMDEILPDDFNDEDEAALIAAEQAAESSTTLQDADKREPEKADTTKDPGLTAGVAAALAKYRANTTTIAAVVLWQYHGPFLKYLVVIGTIACVAILKLRRSQAKDNIKQRAFGVMEEVRTPGLGMPIARNTYSNSLRTDSAFTYSNDFGNKLHSDRPVMAPQQNVNEAYQEDGNDDPSLQSFTATGRPMPKARSQGSGMTALTGSESNGAGAPNLLPVRFTDDSIISVPVMPSEEETNAHDTNSNPVKDMDEDSSLGPIKEEKRRFSFFHRKSSRSSGSRSQKIPPFVMKDMRRSEYLMYYAKDDDGNYVGTKDPAPDCILKNEKDRYKYRKQYAFREAMSNSPHPMSIAPGFGGF